MKEDGFLQSLGRDPFILLALLFFAGCSGARPKIHNLELHESFTHEKIVAQKMCVGGVVSFDIYDLLESVSVMSGSPYKRGSKSRGYGETEDKNVLKAFVQSMGSALVQPYAEEFLQPSAPDFEKNLVRVFRGLAKRLP